MCAKAKSRYEILRVAGDDYRIDDPDGCEVIYRDTERPLSTRRSDTVTDLLERIDELECANDRLEELKHASPWQPIECAPRDGTWVLVACASRRPDEDSYPASVARWSKGYLESGCWGERWCVDGNVDLGWYPEPTHWMLIPKLEVE